MPNPIKAARLRSGKTLQEFAQAAGVHPQALYLNEQGCYPHILPAIERYMRGSDSASEKSLIQLEYEQFQLAKREDAGRLFGLSDVELGPPAPDHPVAQFRAHIGIAMGHPNGLSRMAFAKTFCIHSAELYSLERGEKHFLSEQFKLAMQQAGVPDTVVEELDFRCREFANGEYVSRDSTSVQ